MTIEERPWGMFHVLDEQPGFKVKRLVVKDGGRVSLQSHRQRSEHWTIVSGLATVTIGDRVMKLQPGQSADIPLGAIHRLESLDGSIVEVIEVEFGDYLGEDDIIRHEDAYHRT